MESIWLGLSPSARSTRILAMRGPGETILKAHLSLRPASSRAVTALFEAISVEAGPNFTGGDTGAGSAQSDDEGAVGMVGGPSRGLAGASGVSGSALARHGRDQR